MTYKIVTCITTYNRINYLKKIVNSWKKTISAKHKHHLIIADDGSKDGSIGFLKSLSFEKNISIILNNRVGVAKQTNSMFLKSLELGFDYGFKSDDDIWFLKEGWDDLYIESIKSSGYDHLCYHNPKWISPKRRSVVSGKVSAKTSVLEAMGCFWTFTNKVLEKVGKFDEKSFGFMGHEHIDYSMRCCRAGFNDRINFFDANNSNDFIEMRGRKESYVSSLSGKESGFTRLSNSETKRRWSIILDESRVKL